MLLKNILKEGPNDPVIFKAIFLAGGPGSGKSYVVKGTALEAMGFKVINSDYAFEHFMRKLDMEMNPENIYSDKGQETRNYAKKLTDKKQGHYLKGALGLVIDGTGRDYNKIAGQANTLREHGYEVAMIFVNTSLETALHRNQKRKRQLPDDKVKMMWEHVQNNMGKFQHFFRQSFFVIDNNENSDTQTALTRVYKDIMNWAKTSPNSQKAKEYFNK